MHPTRDPVCELSPVSRSSRGDPVLREFASALLYSAANEGRARDGEGGNSKRTYSTGAHDGPDSEGWRGLHADIYQ